MLSRGGTAMTVAPGAVFGGAVVSADAWMPQKKEPLWAMFKKDEYATNYTPHENGVIIFGSSYFGIVYCVNPDGTTRWIWRVSEHMPGIADGDMWFYSSPPVVDEDGTIYMCDDGLGYLWAITPNGDLKWAHKLDNCGTWAGAAISPDGKIYCVGGNESFTCADNKIYILNKLGIRVAEVINETETLMHHNLAFMPDGTAIVGGMDPGEVVIIKGNKLYAKFYIGYSVVSRPVKYLYLTGISGYGYPGFVFTARDYKIYELIYDLKEGTWFLHSHDFTARSPPPAFGFWDVTPSTIPSAPYMIVSQAHDRYGEGVADFTGTFLVVLYGASTFQGAIAYNTPDTYKTYGSYQSAAISRDLEIDHYVVRRPFGDPSLVPISMPVFKKGIVAAYPWGSLGSGGSEGGLMIYGKDTDNDLIRISDSLWSWSGWSCPTIAGNRIYVVNNNVSYLYCYDRRGNLIWQYALLGIDSGSDTTPAVVIF